MNDLQRYLVSEVATDHVDGLITRREAMRRLLLMGMTAAAASSLIAACSDSKDPNAPPNAPPSDASFDAGLDAGSDATLATQEITFGPQGNLLGAWAQAASPRGAVLVIHENRGLLDHFRAVATRFASAGYSALALDLLSEEGGTAAVARENDGGDAAVTAALNKVAGENPGRFVTDMRAALDELARRTPGVKLGAIGFCFGGGMIWRLVAAKDPRLAAAAPFYGPLPDGADFTGAVTAVLGVYGALDTRVNASQSAARTALEKASLPHEIVTYEGADHAFYNDTGARYNADAAAKAWAKVLDWYGQYIG
ncbi:dienelactone hydrolase family protein [Pendulispora brunnea]|uniref:Dienelactone hydrolase family protein n=1 Tax=Pendulispora brunnea TaxID=2905690 RepID=A0ABZ2KFH2_9BACT